MAYSMAGNFGGLLKICYLAEFTLSVEPVLAIMIFIAKWLVERAGNLTGPRPSTSCTSVWLAITMLQYNICLGIVLTVILVLGLGLEFGIILYFVIGT